jgi:hypothetical protein
MYMSFEKHSFKTPKNEWGEHPMKLKPQCDDGGIAAGFLLMPHTSQQIHV